MTDRSRAIASAILALAWAGLLFWESSQPDPFPFVPRGILSHDKLLHFGAYAVLGALLFGTIARTRLRTGHAIAIVALAGALYGVTDEWHQRYVPNRQADPADVAADTIGALAGAAVAAVILRGRMARASIRAD